MDGKERLIRELIKSPESEWLEFKHNNYNPEDIGRNISALANGATLKGRSHAYVVWGIGDNRDLVGTEFDHRTAKQGNEDILNWLTRLLSDNARYEFHAVSFDQKRFVVLEIEGAVFSPVTFKKAEYVRVGSSTKSLNDVPELKDKLWKRLHGVRFEEIYAKSNLSAEDALKLLSHATYFDVKEEPVPTRAEGILYYFEEEGIMRKQEDGRYSITNLGAILFAKHMSSFPGISRKALRVVQYGGKGKTDLIRDYEFEGGYIAVFDEAIRYINALLPTREVIESAMRRTVSAYPPLAIREAVANALIHQDFSITGTGPMVEVFSDRVEVSNPGTPMVEIERVIDSPPRSRNERLASLMRKLRVCEELGTGWDKMASECEKNMLPAPRMVRYEESTKVVLFPHTPYKDMPPEDRVYACYVHACLKHVFNEQMNNASLRVRFGLDESSTSAISRLISETGKRGLIKPYNSDKAGRYMRYVPFWA
ncbi:MAG: putative DNA binding domain-containing protein [Methanomassiliicoccaceae archaeon]|nr:putative DNA binding domain-containing protein [Methanomassiliicoccaceae archaeon]